jgi:hypothetical protein
VRAVVIAVSVVSCLLLAAPAASAKVVDRDTGSPGAKVDGDIRNPGTIRIRATSEPAQTITGFWNMSCFTRSGKLRTISSRKIVIEGSGVKTLRKPRGKMRRCIVGLAANVVSGTVRLTLTTT